MDFQLTARQMNALTLTHGNGPDALMTLRLGTHQAEARLAARGPGR